MGIANYLYKRKLFKADQANLRKKVFQNLSEIQSVLVLNGVGSLEEKQKWDLYFSNLSKKDLKFSQICFIDSKEQEQKYKGDDEFVIFPSHVGLSGQVKFNESVKGLLMNDYDLLIDLNLKGNKALNLLFVMVKTNLRVGGCFNSSLESFLDLKIKTNDPLLKPKLFIDQILYYLGKININGNK